LKKTITQPLPRFLSCSFTSQSKKSFVALWWQWHKNHSIWWKV
jgi:hypothetical protein